MKRSACLAALSVGFLLPGWLMAQTTEIGLNGTIEEFILAGDSQTADFYDGDAGAYKTDLTTLSRSGSRAQCSAAADKDALVVTASSRASANDMDAIVGGDYHVSASASDDASFIDTLYVSTKAGLYGTLRLTFLLRISSVGERTSTHPTIVQAGYGGGASVAKSGNLIWNASFNNGGNLLNGDYFVELDISEMQYGAVSSFGLRVSTSAQAGASGGRPQIHTSAFAACRVAWCGVAFADYAPFGSTDFKPTSNYVLTNAVGRDYRLTPRRGDLNPTIQTGDGHTVTVKWPGNLNIPYQVQSSTALGGSWAPVGNTVFGNGANSTTQPIESNSAKFYRVVDEPLQ